MKVAALQMTSGSNLDNNLLQASELIKEAADKGAALIVLPEVFAYFAKQDKDYLGIKEHEGEGKIQDFLRQQANEFNVYIVGATIPLTANDPLKVRNSVLMFNPKGEQIGRYDKAHLFDVQLPDSEENYLESAIFESGNDIVIVDTEFARVGLSVCYDLRFPEMYRIMSQRGVDIILVPSAFTKLTGNAHWKALLKARAIENLAYIVAANQTGCHDNGRETYGHSKIVDPWGKTLDTLESGIGVAIADINRQHQEKIQQQFPVLNHRRFNSIET